MQRSLLSRRMEETAHSNYNHFSILQWNGNCIAWTRRAFARLRQLSLCSSNGTRGRMQIAPGRCRVRKRFVRHRTGVPIDRAWSKMAHS